MEQVIAAVLTGGASTRMGSPKATYEIAGRPMAEWVLGAVDGLDVIACGRPLGDLPTVEDGPGVGPLAGLIAALGSRADSVFLTAIDHPWLRRATVDHLIARYEGLPVVPIAGGTRQVTCAVYPSGLADDAQAEAERGGSVQSLLDGIQFDAVEQGDWATWGEDGRSWFSVDDPGSARRGLERFGPPEGP